MPGITKRKRQCIKKKGRPAIAWASFCSIKYDTYRDKLKRKKAQVEFDVPLGPLVGTYPTLVSEPRRVRKHYGTNDEPENRFERVEPVDFMYRQCSEDDRCDES